MILGLFIGLAVGCLAAAIVYWLLVRRINELLASLKDRRSQLERLENEHAARLKAATDQLRLDYEQQLTDKIEYYQDEQIIQAELQALEFETRLSVIETAYDRELEMQR
ncbi:hypothetical protein [cf. Phormidesmis sp. LEGE 11477]|uniref:hypothetical protein n=1 Tax=cf. Phormidesmis sp. LEGE 11477 TaxID=1828680 RepID=UPI001881DF63|nr:hypothetical protein [cf. Phormidesmis sp. LEGE 11477]MBE9062077.1 hypothetical protein [cf. Phormidesmis sp. LEGE 11477]